jgi:phosphoglycolate phosphatase-like HAD superfamily hydrolase
MKVVIFDIDGTLTETNAVDSECFIQTVREVLGVVEFDTDWRNYQFVTDSGIAQEISQRHCDRPMSGSVTKAFYKRLFELLEAQPDSAFQEVPGAIRFIKRLESSPDYAVAFATGAHRDSARHKLKTAGFDLGELPLASSSDAVVREHIMLKALDLAAQQNNAVFEEIIYFGDAAWDVEATANLAWKLIGIGPNIVTGLVFPDYTDADGILKVL